MVKILCYLSNMEEDICYFIALVVVGAKEQEEVETGMEAGLFTNYVKTLYDNTAYSAMGKWLMIEVKECLYVYIRYTRIGVKLGGRC